VQHSDEYKKRRCLSITPQQMMDLRMAEPVPATARALRKAGGHSRGILVLGLRFDLLAFPANRLGGGLKLALPAMH